MVTRCASVRTMTAANSRTRKRSSRSGAKKPFRRRCSRSPRATSRSLWPWAPGCDLRRNEVQRLLRGTGCRARSLAGRDQEGLPPIGAEISSGCIQGTGGGVALQGSRRGLPDAQGSGEARSLRRAWPASAGEEFRPPPEWAREHGGGDGQFSFEDVDFSDLFSRFGARRGAGGFAGAGAGMPGQDFEVPVQISIEDAFRGTTLELQLSMPEYDEQGRLRRVPHTIKARVAPGAVDGQRLRLPGKGGKGFRGGRDGDLYLDISLQPHRLYRATGHDLYVDLPLAPWEAALGA